MSIELGLQRIQALLRQRPMPWRAVHVAGTNGKGSVCTHVSRLLEHSGVRTGRFTSPHLMDRWDCIHINNRPISKNDFLAAESVVHERDRKESIGATPFEILTATAFELFTVKRVEVGIVEVGMGGRLDATNVITDPLVSIITRIGLDHQAFLGDTIEKIAREKAGICKANAPVLISDDNTPEVRSSIWQVAKEAGAIPMAAIPRPDAQTPVRKPGSKRTEISFTLEAKQSEVLIPKHVIPGIYKSLRLQLPRYKLNNMTLALVGSLVALQRLGRPLPNMQELTRFWSLMMHFGVRGRQEMISIKDLTGRETRVLLDGAHNPQAAHELASAVRGMRLEKAPVVWVVAVSKSRDIRELLDIWVRPHDVVVCCEFGVVDGMPWAKPSPSSAIASVAKDIVGDRNTVDCSGDILLALKTACRRARIFSVSPFYETPLVVAGSLYLVSEVLKLLREARPTMSLESVGDMTGLQPAIVASDEWADVVPDMSSDASSGEEGLSDGEQKERVPERDRTSAPETSGTT